MRDVVRGADTGSEPLVELRGVKTYYEGGGLLGGPPVKAVDGVDLAIRRGETLGLVGESGCGKTTLGRTIMGLESPTAGEIRVAGAALEGLSAAERRTWRRTAAVVFQDPEASLDDRMTVGEIVREPLDVHDWPRLTVAVEDSAGVRGDADVRGDAEPAIDGRANAMVADDRADVTVTVGGGDAVEVAVRERLPLTAADLDVTVESIDSTLVVDVSLRKARPRIRREHVRNLLATVGLERTHFSRYPHQFSGGQRQRVGIARALALEPGFLVLDEPVSALDVSVQAKILNLLADLQADLGLTYLLIAHDLSVVRHVCDRVAVMYLGRLMEVGPTEALFDDPANPYTRALLSAIPDPDPTTDARRITLRGTPPSPRDPPAGCPFSTRCPVRIRPEPYRDLDDDLWERIETFREVLRERSRAEPSLTDRAKELLGVAGRFADVEAVAADLFSDVEVPPRVQAHLDAAANVAAAGDDEAARRRLREAFGSECDAALPEQYAVGDAGRVSRCHRHDADYDDPGTAYDRLLDRPTTDGAGE